MIPPWAFGEIARRLQTENALPYVFIALLVFSASLCGFAPFAGKLTWLLGILGSISTVVTLGLIVYTVLRTPSQLRTERHEQIMRYMDFLESQDFDEATQAKLVPLIENQREPATSRRKAIQGRKEQSK